MVFGCQHHLAPQPTLPLVVPQSGCPSTWSFTDASQWAGQEEVEATEAEGRTPVPNDDANYDPDLIPGIDTSEDVIEFYGKYGQDRCGLGVAGRRCMGPALRPMEESQ